MAEQNHDGLQLDLREMINLMSRQQDLISSLGEKGAHLDETKLNLTKEVEELRTSLRDATTELNKANDIIQKLQDDGNQFIRKLKIQENLLNSQDAQLKIKDERINQISGALNGTSERLTKAEAEVDTLRKSKLECEETMKALQETLLAKDNMVAYLGKQILENEGIAQKTSDDVETLRSKNAKFEVEIKRLKDLEENFTMRLNEFEISATENQRLVDGLTKQLHDSEGLSKLMTQEIQVLRKNNTKLDTDYHEKNKALANSTSRVSNLESELKEKNGIIARQQELIASLGDKGVQLEQKKNDLIGEIEDLKSHLNELNCDFTKANDIIRKLQEDGRLVTRKLKSHENILAAKEKELKMKIDGLSQTHAALKSATEKLTEMSKELDDTRLVKSDLEQRLKESDAALTAKENMITYLSKQLNDYEGLTNLEKFRNTLTLTNTLNDTTGKNGSIPSWMHMYNSTLRNQQQLNQSSTPENVQKAGDPSTKKAIATQVNKTPTWAKSNKATLDNLLPKKTLKK